MVLYHLQLNSTYIIQFDPYANSEVVLLWLCPFLEDRLRNSRMVDLALNRCPQEENTPSVKDVADANKDK